MVDFKASNDYDDYYDLLGDIDGNTAMDSGRGQGQIQ